MEEMKNDFFEEYLEKHKKYDEDEILEDEKNMGHEGKNQEIYGETEEENADYNNQKICSEVLDDADHGNQKVNGLKINSKMGNNAKRKKSKINYFFSLYFFTVF